MRFDVGYRIWMATDDVYRLPPYYGKVEETEHSRTQAKIYQIELPDLETLAELSLHAWRAALVIAKVTEQELEAGHLNEFKLMDYPN